MLCPVGRKAGVGLVFRLFVEGAAQHGQQALDFAEVAGLGLANVNIASMAVSRSRAEGGAVMAVTVDSPVPDETVREIANVDGFAQVWFAALDVE